MGRPGTFELSLRGAIATKQSLRCPDFNLRTTLTSGQVFRWRSSPPGFIGWIDFRPVRVVQKDSTLLLRGGWPEAAAHFFSLDADLPVIARRIDADPIIHQALKQFWGLRVIRQEPWECLASFILSAYNNIPRLTGMLDRLALHLGRKSEGVRPLVNNSFISTRGLTPFAFPKPEVIAQVSERVLRNLGLGYRAPYLKAAAQAVASGAADLKGWASLEDEPLRRALLTIPGVGEKVVECVMLFAYERAAAFPVDVWIGRAMRRWYFKGRKVSDLKIREFALGHFGPHCGWAQQVLYCYARRICLDSTPPSGPIS